MATYFEQVSLKSIGGIIRNEKSAPEDAHPRERSGQTPPVQIELTKANPEPAVPPFDVFSMELDGSLVWRAAATTIDRAKGFIQHYAETSGGQFVILNQRTGEKLVIIK